MSKLDELKAAFEASTRTNRWEVLRTSGLPHVVCLTENEVDVMTVAACGGDKDAEFTALAHNLMPTLLEAVGVVEAVAQGEAINSELEDRAAGILYKLLYGKELDQ